MQGQLGERDLPAVFAAGLYAPALHGSSQAAVQVCQYPIEIGDHDDVQRGGVGLLELDAQAVQVICVAHISDAPLDMAFQGARDGAYSLICDGTTEYP